MVKSTFDALVLVGYLVVRVNYVSREAWRDGDEQCRVLEGWCSKHREAHEIVRTANKRLQTVGGFHRWALGRRSDGIDGAQIPCPKPTPPFEQLRVPPLAVLLMQSYPARGRCDHCQGAYGLSGLFRVSAWDACGQVCRGCLGNARTFRATLMYAARVEEPARWIQHRRDYLDRKRNTTLLAEGAIQHACQQRADLAECERAEIAAAEARKEQERAQREAAWNKEREAEEGRRRLQREAEHAQWLAVFKEQERQRRADAEEAKAQQVRRRSVKGHERALIVAEYKQTCAYCKRRSWSGEKDPDGMTWHIDHMVPISRGGTYALSNLVLSCKKCNHKKSAKQGIKVPTPIGLNAAALARLRTGAQR